MNLKLISLFQVILLNSVLCFSQNNNELITNLKNIAISLPRGENKGYLTSYDFDLKEDLYILNVIETRYSPDGRFVSPQKGIYSIHFIDIDTNRMKLRMNNNNYFNVFIPCRYDLEKTSLIITDGIKNYGEYSGSYITLGEWNDTNSKIQCQNIIDIIKKIVSQSTQTALTKESFDTDSLKFNIKKITYYKFDNKTGSYIFQKDTLKKGEIFYDRKKIRIIFPTEKAYEFEVGRIYLEDSSDRILIDVKNNDFFTIAFTNDKKNITLIGEDYKIIFELE